MKPSFAIFLTLALFAAAHPANAQEQFSKLEAYGGYYYARFNVNANVPGIAPSATYNGTGGGGQLEYDANRWLGVVGDLGGYAVARNGFATAHQISYLFGPRVNFRGGRVTPFAQVLLGAMWASDAIVLGSKTAFGTTAGGGIDVTVSCHFAVRPIQAEYFLTKFPDGANNRQNNFRYSAGITFRFGHQ